MKIPRDINGEELVKFLKKYGYEITRQNRKSYQINNSQKWNAPYYNS